MSTHEILISRCLMLCLIMLIIMVGIGGYTRLSGSGLSIVEWKPIIGILPPLSRSSWMAEFTKYQSSPEYQLVHSTMTLDEFKLIYLVEYFHRFWGRAMGIVLAVPTIYAFFKLPRALPGLITIWILSAAQAVMGWYMVKSGLVDNPIVSPYRLTAHLLLAILILGVIIRNIAILMPFECGQDAYRIKPILFAMMVLITITISFGGLTAGTHAGLMYNTFPDMNGSLFPAEFLFFSPWYKDILTNPASIQFIHRSLAITTTIVGLYVYLHSRALILSRFLRYGLMITALTVATQFSLGIFTLLLQVPILLGVAHQVCATVLFAVVSACYFGIVVDRGRKYNLLARKNAEPSTHSSFDF